MNATKHIPIRRSMNAEEKNKMSNLTCGSMRDVLLDTGPKDYTDDGRCVRCGGCCSAILPLTEPEKDRIRKYIKRYRIRPVSHGPADQDTVDMVCPFLDDGEEPPVCRIYEVRPSICRHYTCHAHADKKTASEMILRLSEVISREGPQHGAHMGLVFYPEDTDVRKAMIALSVHKGEPIPTKEKR